MVRKAKVVAVAVLTVVWMMTCRTAASADETPRMGKVSPTQVLVVVNKLSPDSVAIADYYVKKRRIPAANLCTVACTIKEDCSVKELEQQIEEPIRKTIAHSPYRIDYIVVTKGIPIRVYEGGYSTDSLIAVMQLPNVPEHALNPYFEKEERFSHQKFGIYLVTRLDGYTRADCFKLVDDSLAAKPSAGEFLFHLGPGHDSGDYKKVNDGMRRAYFQMVKKRLESTLDTKQKFAGGTDLMGYFSWGSNDVLYDANVYHSLTFRPGAIAETAVSTSGRTFTNRTAPGQSKIADLIAQGVTGCKGYVSEPFAVAIAHADILFDRYTSGYNLAESFYMASLLIHWKDTVIGDPLCAPYAR